MWAVYVCCSAFAALAAFLFYFLYPLIYFRVRLWGLPSKVEESGPYRDTKIQAEGGGVDTDVCDVFVVGAGPSGAVYAYYLAKSRPDLRIYLADRCHFPRKKYCGDAWCAPALSILEDMGVLSEIEAGDSTLPLSQEYERGRPLCRPVQRGGFISPFGHECIGGPYGSSISIRTYAIKRYIVDEFVARKAAEKGAHLLEECEIETASFNKQTGIWDVLSKNGHTFRTRVLVIADGSSSFLARKLGYVTTQPDSVCSHQYIRISEGDRDRFDADGVMFFTRSLLPGYTAIFKHYDGDIYLGTYILPGGRSTSTWIKPFEDELLRSYTYIRNAVGLGREAAQLDYRENKKVAPIRTGGEARTFGEHLMIIGDAAGQVDPLTGEGIHTAMIAGKIAAEVTKEMFENGDFSSKSTSVYQRRWMEAFGEDFVYSSLMASALVALPIAVDAMAVVGKRKGQAFLDEFGEMMTGVKSKSGFLKPHLAVPLAVELVRQIFLQYVLGQKSCVPDCGKPILEGKLKKE